MATQTMSTFVYSNPTKVVFGKGTIAKLAELVPAGARVLLAYGGGSIKKNGVYDQVVKAIKPTAEFAGIEPNPEYETCMRCVQAVKEHNIDFILAVGGGSVLDGCKFISVAAKWDRSGEPWDILTKWGAGDKVFEPRTAVPLASVMTIPATGSESNSFSVMSRRALSAKKTFAHPLVQPVFCVLDPEVTYSLPEVQVANGIVDAIVHVMEQYACHHGTGAVQDEYSEGLMRVLMRDAVGVIKRPTFQNRADFMWAANQALNGLIACGVCSCWGTHMIGHEITAFYGLDHGQTLAIVMPSLLRHVKEQRKEKLAQMAERVFGVRGADDMAEEAIRNLEAFFESIGHHTKLSKYGKDGTHFAAIAVKFEMNPIAAEGLLSDSVLAILKACL